MSALKQAIIDRKLSLRVLSDRKMRYATVLLHKHNQKESQHIFNPIMGRNGWYSIGEVCWVEYNGMALITSKDSFDYELDVHIGLWDLRYTEVDKEYLMRRMYPTDKEIRELEQIFAAEDYLIDVHEKRTSKLRINRGFLG